MVAWIPGFRRKDVRMGRGLRGFRLSPERREDGEGVAWIPAFAGKTCRDGEADYAERRRKPLKGARTGGSWGPMRMSVGRLLRLTTSRDTGCTASAPMRLTKASSPSSGARHPRRLVVHRYHDLGGQVPGASGTPGPG